MTKEEVKALLPVMQAWVNGKDIELRGRDDEEDPWEDVGNNYAFGELGYYEYRIKPEYEYRPFKDAEECWNEMQKHQPFGWLQNKSNGFKLYILSVDDDGSMVANFDEGTIQQSYKTLYLNYNFADGVPFGIKKE